MDKIIKKEIGQRGITLVALVITIIIMLILAGVTLSIALGENGLFNMARNGVNAYKEKAKEEDNNLKELEKQLGKLTTNGVGSSVISNNLKEYQGKYVDIGLDTNGNGDVDDWELLTFGQN